MPTVKALFRTYEMASRAQSALRSVFADDAVSLSTYPAHRAGDDADGEFDPSASAALIDGAPVATMPAAGYNLIGNSATVDVRLGDFPQLVEAVAESEHDPDEANFRRGGARAMVSVVCDAPAQVESARRILARYGGERLRIE